MQAPILLDDVSEVDDLVAQMEANFAAIPSLQGPTTAHHSFATLKDIYLESAARSTGLGSEDLVDDLDDPASTTLQANS